MNPLIFRRPGITIRFTPANGIAALLLLWIMITLPLKLSASETGYLASYEEKDRLHSDSGSYDSRIKRLNQEAFAEVNLGENLSFYYRAQQQNWSLSHADGTVYVDLSYRHHQPRLTYQSERLKIKLSLSVWDIARNDELYDQIEQDDKNRFVMPAINGEYRLSQFLLEAGAWQEQDFQSFNYHRYSVFVYRVATAGVGYTYLDKHQVKLNAYRYDRIYPEEYEQTKDEYVLQNRFLNLYTRKDRFKWKECTLKYIETHYPAVILREYKIVNHVTFNLLSLTHFLTYDLTATNYFTTYRQGLEKYTLIEEDQAEDDLIQTLEYAGFTRISTSSFFLGWKYAVEDSMKQNAKLEQTGEIKLTYAF